MTTIRRRHRERSGAAAPSQQAAPETAPPAPVSAAAPPAPAAPGEAATPAEPREVQEIPLGVRRMAAWSWRMLVVVAAGAVLLEGLVHVASLAVPVLIAILFAAMLTPLVSVLVRHAHLPRALASAIALVGLVIVVLGMGTLAGQQLVNQFSDIQDQAVAGFERLSGWVTSTFRIDTPVLDSAQAELLKRVQENSSEIVQGALTGVETLGTFLTGVFICLFTLFFLLLDGAKVWQWVVGLLPPQARSATHESFRRGWRALSAYVRTQILVAAINGTGIGLGMVCLGLMPYAVPVFLIVFLFSFIPLLGAIVSGAIAVLLVLVLKSWVFALVMVGIVILVHFIEADVLHPFMMGKAVSLHPLGVFLGVALGTELAGIAGALFAIPLAAFLNATLLHLTGRDPHPELGEDPRMPSLRLPRRLRGTGGSARAPRDEASDVAAPGIASSGTGDPGATGGPAGPSTSGTSTRS